MLMVGGVSGGSVDELDPDLILWWETGGSVCAYVSGGRVQTKGGWVPYGLCKLRGGWGKTVCRYREENKG